MSYIQVMLTDDYGAPVGYSWIPDTVDLKELAEGLQREANDGKLMGLPVIVTGDFEQ